MAVEKMNVINTLDDVMTNKDIPVDAHVDVVTADAYIKSKKASDHVEEVMSELEKKSKEISTPSPEESKVKAKNIYTKLTLDESLEDFSLTDDSREEDDYLDYDMFDFVYGIVTDDWPKPKNPLGRPMRKFQHTESDDYKKKNAPNGPSQVSGDMEGNVVVYANEANAFDDVKAVCDHYHITYRDVTPKKSKESHWNYSLTIEVPMTADKYPVMVEDFFADYGLTMSDVIEDHKVGKGNSANWGKTYQTKVEKDRKEVDDVKNDSDVEETYIKYVHLAGSSSDPLEGFLKDMFKEMKSKGLKFSKKDLTNRFMDEFDDSFDDEE